MLSRGLQQFAKAPPDPRRQHQIAGVLLAGTDGGH